jgi:tetratricopeptide (TPR) repeat protein
VTTASDVYSLAVLLYELLTGSRPFDWSRHSVQGVAAAVRRLPVPLPSTVVASSPSRRPASDEGGIECPADLAAKRSTTRRALRKRLAGDLDAVLLRGLRADVQERYGSVEELREDLSRHRLGLPVLARRATVAYRLGRFLQRHATAAVVAVVLVVLVMGFSAFTFVQSRELRRQRDRAATAIDFLVTSLADADPWRGGTTELTARQMLASAVRRARSELGTQPVLRAEVLKSVGVVYEGLGAYAEAEEVAGEALVLLRGDKDKRRENVAELLELLAKTHAGRGDHAAAEGLAREGLFILESVGGDSIAIARAQTVLAGMVAESGRYDEAERLVLSAADRLRAANGAATAQAAATLRVLAGVRLARGDSRAAEEAISEALRLHREIHGEVHAEVAGDIAMLAEILVIRGDWARALVPAREAFELHRDIFDRGHPQTQSSRSRLGIVLMFLGEHEESEALLREALDLERESPPADPLSTAHHLDNLASVLEPQGAYLEARELRRQALGIARSRLGSDHPDLAVVLNNLASNLIYTQDYDEAESLLRESLAIRRRNTPHHLDVATVLFNLGNLLKVNGGLDEAEEMYRQGLEMRRELAGAGSVYVAQSLEALGDLYIGSDRAEEGLELALEARQIYAASYPEDHWRHAFVRALEGAALARLERFEESERLLLDSLRDLERSLGPDAYETRAVDRRIERLYELWERPHREGAGGGSSSRGGSRAAPSR